MCDFTRVIIFYFHFCFFPYTRQQVVFFRCQNDELFDGFGGKKKKPIESDRHEFFHLSVLHVYNLFGIFLNPKKKSDKMSILQCGPTLHLTLESKIYMLQCPCRKVFQTNQSPILCLSSTAKEPNLFCPFGIQTHKKFQFFKHMSASGEHVGVHANIVFFDR